MPKQQTNTFMNEHPDLIYRQPKVSHVQHYSDSENLILLKEEEIPKHNLDKERIVEFSLVKKAKDFSYSELLRKFLPKDV